MKLNKLLNKNSALLLVDIQKAFLEKDYPGIIRNNEDAEFICGKILKKWRTLDLPVIHVRHSSTNPESKLHKSKPGFEFNDYVIPLKTEMVLTKKVNSAFIGTDLDEKLKDRDISALVIAGMTTNHCISTTVRMAGNLGYDTTLVSDASATFDRIGVNGEKFDSELIHQTTLANLRDEFAKVITTAR
mgnify:CR=1 FL=1